MFNKISYQNVTKLDDDELTICNISAGKSAFALAMKWPLNFWPQNVVSSVLYQTAPAAVY